MSVLTRAWQMLLKGIDETLKAPSEKQAAEMVLIRLAYAADLPTPAKYIESLQKESPSFNAPLLSSAKAATAETFAAAPRAASVRPNWGGVAAVAPVLAQPAQNDFVTLNSLADLVAFAYKQNELMFAYNVEKFVSIVSYEQGKIEFFPVDGAPHNLAGEMVEKLRQWTGRKWIVTVVSQQGGQTLLQQARANTEKLKQDMTRDPLVSAVLKAFPKSRIDTVRPRKAANADEEDGDINDAGYAFLTDAAAQSNDNERDDE